MSSAKRRGQWKRREEAAAKFQEWAQRLSTSEPYAWDEESVTYEETIDRLSEFAESPVSLPAELWDPLAWRLGQLLNNHCWQGEVPVEVELKLLRDCVVFLKYAATQDAKAATGAVMMFWDIVCHSSYAPTFAAMRYGPITGRAEDSPDGIAVSEGLFVILLEMASDANPDIQVSALHGLNHLCHPRTAQAIERIMDRLADDHVRQFARAAAEFSLP